eukprot:gene3733-4302_t
MSLYSDDPQVSQEIAELEKENAELQNERVLYIDLLESLTSSIAAQRCQEDIDAEIVTLERQEAELLRNLEQIRIERNAQKEVIQDLQARYSTLAALETRYWHAYSDHVLDANRVSDRRASVATKISSTVEMLNTLDSTNLLNTAFHLWYDGHFGTINTLRLGRLRSHPVEWNEINSAWGLAVSLLDNLAKRLSYKFITYRLLPNGSASKIEEVASRSVYELYGSSDISLGRLLLYVRFDNGMVSYLQCLHELCQHVNTVHDPLFQVPYVIDRSSINGMSIKMQFTNEDTWTKALKYMLTNLKWLLSWVTNLESKGPLPIAGQPVDTIAKFPPLNFGKASAQIGTLNDQNQSLLAENQALTG